MAASLTLDGLAGTRIETPDVNLLDADTAHLQQSIGLWTERTAGNISGFVLTASGEASFGDYVASADFVNAETGVSYVRTFASGVSNASIGAAVAYAASARVKLTSLPTDRELYLIAYYLDSGGGYLGEHTLDTVAAPVADGWVTLSGTRTTVASTAHVALGIQVSAGAAFSSSSIGLDVACLRTGTSAVFVPSLRIVGSTHIKARAAATDWTPPAYRIVASGGDGANDGWELFVNNTNQVVAQFIGSVTNPGAVVSTLPLIDGADYGMDAQWNVDSGTMSLVFGEFFNQQAGITGVPVPSPDGIAIGVRASNKVSDRWVGDIYYVEVRDGIDGPVVARLNAGQLPFAPGPIPNGTQWTDRTGRVWTFNGGITFNNPGSARFQSYQQRYQNAYGSKDVLNAQAGVALKRYTSV